MSSRYDNTAVNTTTGPDDLIPAVIINDITASAAEYSVVHPLVRKLDLTGMGDSFTLPTAPSVSFAQLGSQNWIDGTEPVETAFATGARTFTPIHYFVDFVIPMDVLQDAQVSAQEAITKEVAIAWASHKDSLLTALYTEAPTTNPDHELDYTGSGLTFTALREGSKLLYTQNAPRPFYWVVHPTQWSELMSDNALIDAAFKGSPVMTQGLGQNGFATKVFDVGIYVSDQTTLATTRMSMMFADGALAYAFKRLRNPSTGAVSELMVDLDWNAARRAIEVNYTYRACGGGTKATSTTNNWVVEIKTTA